MCINRTSDVYMELPFNSLTDYDIEETFQNANNRIIKLMGDNGLHKFFKDKKMYELFDPEYIPQCRYYDENDFVQEREKSVSQLSIFSFNIRSLTKHCGSLVSFLNTLGKQFDIIVLTEIGFRNIITVERLFHNFLFTMFCL